MMHAKNELRVLAVASLAVVLGASAALQETAGGLRYFTRAALASADMDGIAEYIDATLAKCPAAFAAATDLAATRASQKRIGALLSASAKQARKQIDEKRYAAEMEKAGIAVLKYGIGFSGKRVELA